MILKSGTIIPFIFKDTKKLIVIPSLEENKQLKVVDIKQAVYSAFKNLRNTFEFYNFKIGFQIPEEILIPYLEQRHDLTNFIIEIVEIEKEKEKDDKLDDQNNRVAKSQKSIEKSTKREGCSDSQIEIKKIKLVDSVDKHLENILKTSTKGQAICRNFESSNQLSEEDRAALVELMIDSEIEKVLDLKTTFAIDSKRLKDLTAAIVHKFPYENSLRYFDDEHLKSFKLIAGGKLYKKFIENKIQYILQMERNDKYFDAPEGTIEADFPELEELQKLESDWHSYFRAWQCTFDLRIAYFRNSLDPMGYFEKLISCVHDRTHDLVEYDFERLHPNKSYNLFENWDVMSEKIFTEALVMDRNDVPLILDLYGNLSELSGLMMLSYFVENYERDVKRFEKDDPENLVIHIDSIIGSPEEFFKDYNDSYNLSTPLIFATGKIDDELHFYVLVGSNLFKMESVLKAVDFCFKCYQILQLSYPTEQSLSWRVIQSAFYAINTDNDCAVSDKILKVLKNV